MKILFIGEFSGAYTELIPAVKNIGEDVYHIAGTDGKKGYKSDFNPTPSIKFSHFNFIKVLLGIIGLKHFIMLWPEMKIKSRGYDVVQINCPSPLGYGYLLHLIYFHYLKKHNKIICLSVLGTNYYADKYILNHKTNRLSSSLKGINRLKNTILLNTVLKWETLYLTRISSAIMPMAYWYKKSYEWCKKTTEIVPICLKPERLGNPFILKGSDVIKIFHGWQEGRELEKGNDVFDRVIKRIEKKYGDRVIYQVVREVPYDQYVTMFQDCHIFIDQLYADDKGINGLLGMASGKVVFSGFKQEALALYPGYDGYPIGVECHDDEKDLFDKFCYLIEHPEIMNEISINAIRFVKTYHLNSVVAEQYRHIWLDALKEKSCYYE